MLNKELSKAFDLMADLLEIQEGNRFRINSFKRTARTLKDMVEDVAELAAADQLLKVPGIGKGTAGKIAEFIEQGRIAELDELLGKMPDGLPALLDIPGLGPKKVAAVWKELGIEELGDLTDAIESGRLAELPGFGAQSVKKIAEGIRFMETSGGRVPYGEALPLAEALAERLRGIKGVDEVAIAGSLRRGQDTIGDIDLLCTADDGAAVVKAFVAFEDVVSVLAAGDTKGSVTLPLSGAREVQVDLRVVPAESFGAALQYFSGSKEHNIRLREMAVKQGYKLNEWGLSKGDKVVAGRTEADIYAKLGVSHIPVEMREDRGEFECDDAMIESLIKLEDIRGDLHMHTVASDGKSTLEEMARAARALGYEYINITDHSKSSAIANGLSIERMRKQIDAVRAFDEGFEGLKVLVGCECDILSNGELDYPDELLAQCDIVVASIHSAMGQSRETITQRTLQAIENPHVHIIGHPTSRIINKRPATALDIAEIAQAAARTGTALEINASWKRLDLKDQHIRHAIEAGAMLSINTDSHHVDQFQQMRYGISTARRGWATADRIINTMTHEALIAWKQRSS